MRRRLIILLGIILSLGTALVVWMIGGAAGPAPPDRPAPLPAGFFPTPRVAERVPARYLGPPLPTSMPRSGPASSLRLAVTPAEAAFALGEPIRLRLVMENPSEKPVCFALDMELWYDLVVTWRPKGVPAERAVRYSRDGIRGGITVRMPKVVPPGRSHTEEFLLDRFFTPEEPGEFELAVALKDLNLPPARTTISLRTTIETRSLQRERLREWDRISRSRGMAFEYEDCMRAQECLAYTRSSEALPWQQKFLGEEEFLDEGNGGELRAACVASMLHVDQDAAVRFLVEKLGETAPPRASRWSALLALRQNWERLSEANRKLLEPYRAEIQRAEPVIICD